MEQTNKQLEYHTGYFSGKELVKKGIRKDKDGSDVEWRLYNLILKFQEDAQYGTKFKVFAGCKGWELLDDLEGEPMQVGFERGTYTHTQYGKQESRSVKFICSGKKEDITIYESSIKKEQAKVLPEISDDDLDELINDKSSDASDVETPSTEFELELMNKLITGNKNIDDCISYFEKYKAEGKDIVDYSDARVRKIYGEVKNKEE